MTAILSFPRPSLIETMADREADRLVEAVGMPRTPEELRLFARDIAIMTTAVHLEQWSSRAK